MPRIPVSKEELTGQAPLPPGIYEVRLDGFNPKFSKDGKSINLQPKLVVVNHPTLNDRRIFDNLNSKAGWVQNDFTHAFGLTMVDYSDGSVGIPGDFNGPDGDPSKWNYAGPLSGRIAKLEMAEADNGKGGTTTKPKRYFCAVPGCTEKHSESLL